MVFIVGCETVLGVEERVLVSRACQGRDCGGAQETPRAGLRTPGACARLVIQAGVWHPEFGACFKSSFHFRNS